FREFQRAFLELCGLITYMSTYRPRITDAQGVFPTDPGLMGCFTHVPQIVSTFHRVGIPVWFIRPYEHITPSLNCVEIVSLTPSRYTDR
ncbi:hypothetical protein SISNIDRAFT_396653, partial [Sistotremastrum niveocremeum HHB9708]